MWQGLLRSPNNVSRNSTVSRISMLTSTSSSAKQKHTKQRPTALRQVLPRSVKKRHSALTRPCKKSCTASACKFFTSITEQDPTPNGADRIEFLLAPNPGEGEKSLQKAVSGGELSRVLLAIKSVMAELDKVPLLIFDEVDSGISGETGNSIGEALRNLGKHHQVLTITHLHQVASRAQNQLAVSKKEVDGRTFTSIIDLDKNGRIEEIARMLGGTSETVRTHAKQLLENNL